MPVVAVINRKGGSGKSTLATHLAAYCATSGLPVMLGDADRSQSTQVWLKLRDRNLPSPGAAILGKPIDPRNLLRPPPGTNHVVLDTPGGLHGFELARMVCHADAILLPVCNSIFDRESAAECWAELKTHPRVTSGRCRVASIAMRLDSRTNADKVMTRWAEKIDLPFLGVLRQTQMYVRCVENGLTLFDMPPSVVANDLAQWAPIIEWLKPVLHRPEASEAAPSRPSYRPNLPASERPPGITIPGALTDTLPQAPVRGRDPAPKPPESAVVPAWLQLGAAPSWAQRFSKVFGGAPLRRFLDRQD